MRVARRFRGGEPGEAVGPGPRTPYRPPASASERKARRDVALAMLAGLAPFRPLAPSYLADVFGLSRRQVDKVLARLRAELEGRRDG